MPSRVLPLVAFFRASHRETASVMPRVSTGAAPRRDRDLAFDRASPDPVRRIEQVDRRARVQRDDLEPLSDREKLLFVRGVGERTLQLLDEAGYKSVEDVLREDEDKLAIKTGLGIKKARAIKQGAEHFLSSESKVIESARREAARAAKERAAQA